MATFDDVLTAAQNPPPRERIRSIDTLWDSVPTDEWPAPSDQRIAEAQRRSAEHDAGRMPASPWPEGSVTSSASASLVRPCRTRWETAVLLP
ncbi:MAG: addiction module protein [Planctomycetota bacterium]